MKVRKGWRKIPIDRPLKRPIPYILLILGLLIFLFNNSISYYTEKAFGNILVQVLENQFEDKYIVEYSDIRYNIFRNRINIKEFSVYTDSTKNITEETTLELNTSSFLINFKSLFELLFQKTLTVQRINLIEPFITIIDNSAPDSTTLRQEIDADKAIQNALEQLSFLKINALNIDNATLKILEPTEYTHIGNFSVSIENMGIGQSDISGGRYDLKSTEFELIIEDEEFEFGNVKLEIDKFRISKHDSLLSLEGLKLGSTLSGNEETAEIELMEVTGLDVLSVLTEYNLNANKFLIKSGNLNIDLSTIGGGQDSVRFAEIIKADTLELIDIDLNALVEFKGKLDTLKVENASLTVAPFEASKRILNDPLVVFSEADVILSVEKYQTNFSFIEHKVIGENLEFSTPDKQFLLGDFQMYPTENRQNYINNHVNDFGIYGIQTDRLFLQKELIFDSISAYISNLDLMFREKEATKKIIPDDSLLLTDVDPAPWIRSFINYGHAQKAIVEIDTFTFDINQSTGSLYDMKTVTYNLDYDTSKLNLPYALYESILMNFSNARLTLNKNGTRLRFKRFRKRLEDILISDINFYTRSNSGNYSAKSDLISISGEYLFKSMLSGKLEINDIEIDRPIIRITDSKSEANKSNTKIGAGQKKSLLDTLSIKRVNLRDGALYYTGKSSLSDINSINFQVNEINFLPNQTSKLDIQSLFMDINDIQASVGDNDSISIKSIEFSSADSVLNLDQISYSSIKDGRSLDINVPSYTLSGIDINHFIKTNNIEISRQRIQKPEINYTLDVTNRSLNSEKPKRLTNSFTSPIQLITPLLIFDEGEFNLTRIKNEDSIQLRIPEFQGSMENILVQKSSNNSLNTLISKVNLLTGQSTISGLKNVDSLSFEKLALIPNDGVFINDVYLNFSNEKRDINMKVKSLSLVDNELLKYINEPLQLEEFSVYNPVIRVSTKGDGNLNSASPESRTTKRESEHVEIGQVNLRNAEFYLDNEVFVQSADLTILGYKTDRADNEKHIYNADNLQLRIGSAKYKFPSGLNEISIKDFIFSSLDGSGYIKGITHTPLISKMEYGYAVGLQTDWITATTGDLKIEGFDLFRLVQKNEIMVSELELDDLNMLVFRDKHIPFNDEQRRFLPQTILRNINIPIALSKVKLENATISYEELAENLDTPGRVFFNNMSGSLSNFTNMDSVIAKDPHFIVNASTNIIGEGLLEADFDFRLDSLNDYFTVNAHMGEMDLRKFNTMMEKNYNVLIKSGQADDISFQAQATNDVSWGSMDFLYHDFKINVIGKQNFDTKGVGPGLLTFFANSFVINTNNPHLLRKRDGDIYSERDKRRSVFNYLARLSLSGIISSIGAKNNRKEIKRMYKQQEEERKQRLKEEKNSTKKSTQNEKLNRR